MATDPGKKRETASRIAHGHAFEAHVRAGDDFPEIRTREEFAELIYAILTDPATVKRALLKGREAFWNQRCRAIVILDAFSDDGGTAFRPEKGDRLFPGDDIRNTMEIEAQHSGSLLLRLSAEDIPLWGNALNEVCHGFAVENFEAAIGLGRGETEKLLQRVAVSSPGQAEEWSLEELLAVRNALTAVLTELDPHEFHARMGFDVEEARDLRNRLDSLTGQIRFVRTA